MIAAHTGERPHVSVKTAAEPATANTSPRGGAATLSSTRTSPDTQRQMAAEISKPLGFTTDPRYRTVGVSATNIPTKILDRRDQDLTHIYRESEQNR